MLLWQHVNTAGASPAHGLGMGSLTMGGVSKFFVNMNVTRVKQWTGQAASAPTMAQ